MGLFGISLKDLEAIPGDIFGGVEHLFGGGGSSPPPSNPAPPQTGNGPVPVNPMAGINPAPSPAGQSNPNLAFMMQQPTLPNAPKRDKNGNVIPQGGGPISPVATPAQVRANNPNMATASEDMPLPVLPNNAPQANDTAGLKNALQSMQNFNQDDQARIINRASMAGLLPHNVAGAEQNQILSPDMQTDRSNLGMLGQAVTENVLPGASQMARQVGTNLAAQNLYNKALNGKINHSIVDNTINQSNAENGSIVGPKGINYGNLAMNAVQGAGGLLGLGIGGAAARSPEELLASLKSMPGDVADAVRTAPAAVKNLGTKVAETVRNPDFLKPADPALSSLAMGTEAGLSSVPEEALPNPTTTEANVANVHASNPLKVVKPTSKGTPIPTPPVDEKVPLANNPSPPPSSAELNNLYGTAPNKAPQVNTGAPDMPSDAAKIATPNPNPAQPVSLPVAAAGDFERPMINKELFNNDVDTNTTDTVNKVNQLSPEDRGNFIDYAQGVKPIEKAKDPGLVQQAVGAWRNLADRVHATDPSEKTPYKQNYFPGYYVDKEGNATHTTGTTNFSDPADKGGYRSQTAKFPSRSAAIKGGQLPLNQDPVQDILKYAQGAKAVVGSNITKQAVEEADKANPGPKSNVVLKDGTTVNVSKDGKKALNSERDPLHSPAVNAAKFVNQKVKAALISTGAPHAVIIPQRVAGALTALKTPVLHDMSEEVGHKAANMDNRELGTRINSPMHSSRIDAGVSSESKSGNLARTVNPFTVPKRIVYDHLLPALHNKLLTSAGEYMDKRGIDPDSPEARALGNQINDVLGYSKNARDGALNQALFAPALVRSTANLYAKSLIPGSGGTIARGGMLGQQLTNQAVGQLSKAISNYISQYQGKPQNESHDDFWSTVLKELYKPTIYTPMRNSKNEQTDFNLPGQYQADAIRAVTNLTRGSDGQLHLHHNTPSQVASQVTQTGKDIASPVVGAGVSATTNQTYNGTQVRNPYAPLTTQIEQTAINEASNLLPINAQGLINSSVEKHLPGPLQSAINVSNNSGSQTMKAAGNSLGLNPSSDQTTGQGPATTKYYAGQTAGRDYIAAHSNNINTQNDLLGKFNDYYARVKNNNGQTVQDDPGSRLALNKMLQSNPDVMKAIQVSEKANGKGNYDPMWDLPDDKLQTFLHYQATPTGFPDRDHLLNQNSWLGGFIQQRDQYYQNTVNQGTSVPAPGTPAYPQFDYTTQSSLDAIQNIENTPAANRTPDQVKQLSDLYNQPGVIDAQQAKYAYDNAMQKAEGVSPLQYLGKPDPDTEAALNTYNALPKGDGSNGGSPERAAWIKANPDAWGKIQNLYATQGQNTIDHQAAIAEFQGETPSNSLLGAEKSVGKYDISSTKLANGTTQYSLNPTAAASQSSGTSNGYSSKSSATLSKVLAGEKAASQARDLGRAAKAANRTIRPTYTKAPRRMTVRIKGVSSGKPPKAQVAGVGQVKVPQFKLHATSNKARLKV